MPNDPRTKHGRDPLDSLNRLLRLGRSCTASKHMESILPLKQNRWLRRERWNQRFVVRLKLVGSIWSQKTFDLLDHQIIYSLFSSFALICTPTVLNPESTYSTSPVIRADISEARNTAAFPTSSMVTFSRIGDISAKCLYIPRKPPTPAAASVRIGPAEIAFTRIFCGPKSYAKYRVDDSNAAFATPITL